MIGLVETNEEKLQFLIRNYFRLSQKKLALEFEVTESEMSKIVNNQENKLKNIHLLGFCSLYDVPYEIFKNKKFNTEAKIILFLDNYRNNREKEIFRPDEKLLENIVGKWYAYFYPSNPFKDIYRIETTIKADGSVIDENKNWGRVFFGKNQSMIIKETDNSKNLVSITFDNIQVPYDLFHFSLVSKRNHVNREIFNFGFFSRSKIELDMAKEILGKKEMLQLKMSCNFVERIGEYVEVVG